MFNSMFKRGFHAIGQTRKIHTPVHRIRIVTGRPGDVQLPGAGLGNERNVATNTPNFISLDCRSPDKNNISEQLGNFLNDWLAF